MTSIERRSARATIALAALLILCAPLVSAESPYSPAVRKALDAAFALEERDAVIASLVSGAGRQSLPADRQAVLAVLAGYEERIGLPAPASKHYSEAAWADPAARNDSLLLDGARCAFAAGDFAQADSLIRTVLLSCFDEKVLIRARVYSAWILLQGDGRKDALGLLRSYSANHAYADYAPQILFTLWWAESDRDARDRLLSSCPVSPEAGVVRGEMTLAPAAFWYLMERNADEVSGFAKKGIAVVPAAANVQPNAAPGNAVADPSPTNTAPGNVVADPPKSASSTAAWQQVGFYRSREYAEELVARLREKGFDPVIRSETRPSGTVYHAVLVPEDSGRTMGSRLKDAGFESYLRTE